MPKECWIVFPRQTLKVHRLQILGNFRLFSLLDKHLNSSTHHSFIVYFQFGQKSMTNTTLNLGVPPDPDSNPPHRLLPVNSNGYHDVFLFALRNKLHKYLKCVA